MKACGLNDLLWSHCHITVKKNAQIFIMNIKDYFQHKEKIGMT